jgi:hypothetical protein
MAGLAIFGQNNSIEETTAIDTRTAFKMCFGRRKNKALNRLPSGVRALFFFDLIFVYYRGVTSRPVYRTNQICFANNSKAIGELA